MNSIRTSVLAVALVAFVCSNASAQPWTHLKCYKMKDTQTFHSANADIDTIEPSFGLQNCRIKKKARQICIPATKDVTEITDGSDTPFPVATDDLAFEQICYKITCPQETISPQTVSDQFGSRTVTKLKASTLCVPAVFGPPPTTSTTSTTTTTSTTSTTLVAPAIWSIRAGNSAAQQGIAIGVDSGGNVVAAGHFGGEIDFGLGALTSAGGNDIFVVKLDPSGVPIWNARFGDAADQSAFDLQIDSSDNIVVAGQFVGSVDFGGGTLSSAGTSDAYVVQFDPSGAHNWSRAIGGASGEGAFSVNIDAADDVWLAGNFASPNVDFGGGPIAKVGAGDCYLARYSSAGAHEFSDGYGGALATCIAFSIASDPMGNVLMAASIVGTVDFGGGGLMGAGSLDAVVAKFSLTGVHSWSKRFGDALSQQSASVHSDNLGNVYLAGNASGTVNFGGSALMSAGSNDIFLAKFDGAGTHLFSFLYGDAASQSVAELAVDASGNVHLTGAFDGSVDFGGGALMSDGSNDGFVAKFTSAGAWVSDFAFGDVGDQNAGRIDVDASGNRYLTGTFVGTIDLGDGPLVADTLSDVFIAKLAP
jgi:hypothetical protein